MKLLQDKTALITGAGSGIGRATALAFAEAGAAGLVLADRDPAGGKETEELVRATGAEARFVTCDVTSADDLAAAVDAAVGAYGRLDCAVNNAGYSPRQGLPHELEEDDFDRTLAVNVKGVWLGMRAQLRVMLEAGHGTIVNTASRAGLRGAPTAAGYAASKFGVIGLTQSAALAYVRDGIRVNCICPGAVDTNMVAGLPPSRKASLAESQPAGRLAEPSEMAAAIAWLSSDQSSYVSGVALPVDHGWTAGS